MNIKLFRIIAVLLATVLTARQTASAHAFLDRAEPKVGAKIAKPPAEIKIWFTQELEPAFSKIQIFDSDGKQLDKKDSHLDSKDRKLLIVGVPKLAAGSYKVSWRVVSADTHRTQGNFKFTIKS
ncbi:MAG TPA: copper resistance CopC family protein [Tepidisphaeraceae bacterium]|nr:copper resistance CopC family protein [Tepidisphaeraceae bacterium]